MNWFLPAAHPFESWGDARSREGTLSIVQPLIQPLFGGISEAELLGAFLADEAKPYERLKTLHASRAKTDFDSEWEVWLANGVVPGTASAAVTPSLQADRVRSAAGQARPAPAGLELDLVHDYKILDGRYSLNSWLQELPDPITKVTWDNVAQVGPGLARQMGVANGDLLLLTVSGRSVELPAWVQPGHADDAVTVSIGYGRKQNTLGVKDADEPVVVGHDVYPLRSAADPWFATGLELKKTGRKYTLCSTQVHNVTEGRPIALMQTLEEFEKHPEAPELRPPVKLGARATEGSVLPSVQPAVDYSKQQYKWGDGDRPDACTGCSACVVPARRRTTSRWSARTRSCRGREMHWIRIDRYYRGPADDPDDVTSRCSASTARTRRASTSARSTPPSTATKASTTWSTTAASAPGTARTTARTRSGASTTSTTQDQHARR